MSNKVDQILSLMKSESEQASILAQIDIGGNYLLNHVFSEPPTVSDRALGYSMVDFYEIKHPNSEHVLAGLTVMSGEQVEPIVKIGVILADYKAPGLSNNVFKALNTKYEKLAESALDFLKTSWGEEVSIAPDQKISKWIDIIDTVKKGSKLQKSVKGWSAKIEGMPGWHTILDIQDSGKPASEPDGGNYYTLEHYKTKEPIRVHQSKILDADDPKNLKKVEYLRKPFKKAEILEKPPKSEAQRRFMHAAAAGKVEGVSPSVGKEFVAEDKGGKLPEKVSKNADVVKIPKKEFLEEHKRLIDVLTSVSHKDDIKEAKEQSKELAGLEKSLSLDTEALSGQYETGEKAFLLFTSLKLADVAFKQNEDQLGCEIPTIWSAYPDSMSSAFPENTLVGAWIDVGSIENCNDLANIKVKPGTWQTLNNVEMAEIQSKLKEISNG